MGLPVDECKYLKHYLLDVVHNLFLLTFLKFLQGKLTISIIVWFGDKAEKISRGVCYVKESSVFVHCLNFFSYNGGVRSSAYYSFYS